MEWISVKDRLPDLEKADDYIVVRKGNVETANWCYDSGRGFWYDYLGITHWMPLPEPPTT